MELNGFNSDDYRYFFINKDVKWIDTTGMLSYFNNGDIVKIRNDKLIERLFNSNYYNRFREYLIDPNLSIEERLNSKSLEMPIYPKENAIDFNAILNMIPPFELQYDYTYGIIVEPGEYVLFNDWFMDRLSMEGKTHHWRFPGSSKETNYSELSDKMKLVDSKTHISDSSSLIVRNSTMEIAQAEMLKYLFLPFKKGEVWSIKNPSLAFSLLDQDMLLLLFNSTEILGSEKERLFECEYKDNIQNKTIRYYKVKDKFKVKSIADICSEVGLEDFSIGFSSFTVRKCNGDIKCNKYNKDNFDCNGNIKYFYVEYGDSMSDSVMEKELLKIAVRLDQEHAIIRYHLDNLSSERHRIQEEAIKYANEHANRFKKGMNRLLSPEEFMEKELKPQQDILRLRLVNTFISRRDQLKDVK